MDHNLLTKLKDIASQFVLEGAIASIDSLGEAVNPYFLLPVFLFS